MENNFRDIYDKYKITIEQNFSLQDASDYWFCFGGKYDLPVDVLLDNSEVYTVRDKVPILLFRNGYDQDANFLKIEISDDPKISDILPLLEIYSVDFFKVYFFVVKHHVNLLRLAKEEISIQEFDRNVVELKESLDVLDEMSRFTPEQTGLVAGIWIDNGNTASRSGHSNSDRIKFQNPKQEKDSRRWSSLIIKGLKIESDADIEWTSSEMEDLYRFVEANADMIHIAMQEKWQDDKIQSKLIRIGENGELIYPKKELSYMFVGELGFGFSKVRNAENKFNILDEFGNLLSKERFNHIVSFKENQNKFASCYNFSTNTILKLYPNGVLV